jgi:selenide,water dikinase
VLRDLTPDDDALLVGPGTGDDAAVYALDDARALVVTADFITPVVDDPRVWGRVAATNSVSDVYAMGGRPLLALNLVCWNDDELGDDVLREVLEGARDVARAGRFVIGGGHTVTDPEPKFGLAVVGEAARSRLLTNAGLRPGDTLVLTKPIGVGSITTAIKRGVAPPDAIDAAIASMTQLNDVAAAVALDAGAEGATDVTGFGLLGHLGRMALESRVDVTLVVADIPVLTGARGLIEAGVAPGGTQRNLAWVLDRIDRGAASDLDLALLADPQTSGGLVFGVRDVAAAAAVARLRDTGHDAAVIGRVEPGAGTGRLVLR